MWLLAVAAGCKDNIEAGHCCVWLQGGEHDVHSWDTLGDTDHTPAGTIPYVDYDGGCAGRMQVRM